jgi:membrane associated rhomboid family serine protease
VNRTNPYAPPAVDAPRGGSVDADSEVRPDILTSLRFTRPWVKFLGIVGYVTSALMILGGLFLMVSPKTLKLPGAGAVGVVYAIMGAINLFPSMHLSSYASSLRDLLDAPDMEGLAHALEQQKKFWRFVGIMCAILVAFYALCIVIVALSGIGRK